MARPSFSSRGLLSLLVSLFFVPVLACGSDATPADGGVTPDANPCADDDGDDDGYVAARCGGDDCNDGNPFVNPGAYDGPWDGPRLENWSNLGDEDITTAMALGPDASAHVLVVRNGVAYYAFAGETGAEVRPLLAGGITDGSIAVVGDVVHVTLASAPGALSYQRKGADGMFVPEAVGEPPYDGIRTAVAVAPDGTARAVFDDGGALFHAVRGADAWTIESIAPDFCAEETGCRIGFVVDLEGVSHVVYTDTAGMAQYTSGTPGAFVTESLGAVGMSASAALALAPDGVLHALITGDSVVHHQIGSATEEPPLTLDPSGGAHSPAIRIAADGRVNVLYARGGELLFGVESADSFEPATAAAGHAGVGGALALSPTDGEPVIATSFRHISGAGGLSLLRRTGQNGVDEDCDGTDAM